MNRQRFAISGANFIKRHLNSNGYGHQNQNAYIRLFQSKCINRQYLSGRFSTLNAPFMERIVILQKYHVNLLISSREKSTEGNNEEKQVEKISNKEKIKRAIAAYGSTVAVFHMSISLVSLGACYLLIVSGLDMSHAYQYLGTDEISGKVATSTGTFVVAYALHKVFAPVRIGITLTVTPFIVQYLRKIGILKKPVDSLKQADK